jgi:hypothetical protein
MRVSEKIALIDQVGRVLQSRFTYIEINAFLSEYRIALPKNISANSKLIYSKSALQGIDTDTLRMIAEELGVDVYAYAPSYQTKNGPDSKKGKYYYSVRTGKNPLSIGFDLNTALELFKSVYRHFDSEGYFQEHLGYWCVDSGFLPGKLGHDVDAVILLEVRKRNLTPIYEKVHNYSEDDLFDIIEFLYEHCSKPIDRTYHSYSDCGWHCETFDREPGRLEFREKINKILALYDKGYELSAEGEILTLADPGLLGLFEAPLPRVDPNNVAARVTAAQLKFRRSRSSIEDRRDAIRDLADVLEYLRPKLKIVLVKKDESSLFEIANRFGIRHHDDKQQLDYDKPIWYSWIFYYYLATIHAAVRLIERSERRDKQGES